ncbi:MAG: macro domain-containing protein [Candidatus Omnitrophota bacterium]
MKVIKGDLIKKAQAAEFDVIIHGCNCFCAMGAGIAKSIKTAFPQAYEADLKTTKGDKAKLGTCSVAAVQTGKGKVYVVNAYTQYNFSGRGVLVDYEAIRSCMKWVKKNFSSQRIGIPKLGAGLAGGDWQVISAIINEELSGEDVTLVEYLPG